MGATYQFTLDAASNLRQKDDCYNEAIAGFAAGAVVGVARMYRPTTGRHHADPVQDEAFRLCSVPELPSPQS